MSGVLMVSVVPHSVVLVTFDNGAWQQDSARSQDTRSDGMEMRGVVARTTDIFSPGRPGAVAAGNMPPAAREGIIGCVATIDMRSPDSGGPTQIRRIRCGARDPLRPAGLAPAHVAINDVDYRASPAPGCALSASITASKNA